MAIAIQRLFDHTLEIYVGKKGRALLLLKIMQFLHEKASS
jgi:hypothetical protein